MVNHTAGATAPAQPPAQPTARTSVYLYAIVPAHTLTVLPQPGLDPDHPVYLLGQGQVQALVSRVPAVDFTQEQIAAGLQHINWVETYVRAHQRVLDQVVASGQSLLPLRFCTIYHDEAAVHALLAERERALQAELARLAQKQEWGVKLSIALAPLQTAITNGRVTVADPAIAHEIQCLRQRIAGLSNGAAFLYKKKLETFVTTHADEYAFALAAESHLRLADHAVAVVTNPLPSAAPALRLSGAYLVTLADRTAFCDTVDALAESNAALGFQYELSGPWPPYHFLTLAFDE